MKHWFGKILLLGLLAIVIFFFISGTKPKKLVRLAGSTAFLPYAEKLSEVYMEKYPDSTIDVQGGGSAVGIMVALQGIADIGMVDMLILPKETESMEKIIVATDGIAVIVNKTNNISGLTLSELKDIFTGNISNWKIISGKDAPINVISREEGSGTRKSFDKLVLSKNKLSKSAMYQDSNGTIREAVKSDPYSIGYISIGFLNQTVKAVSIDGVAATNENVKASKYKLARPVFFLLRKNSSGQAKDFVNFVLSAQAQELIAKDGLIPVN